ncbi:hypothetical protein BLL42_02180 [Pseudomonas frederiksbergensis]|uniref:Uncharacterized protein n=1 Tax=Pseudomonas frederiksbergensis TaxID=104087 RepID=A0A1J0EEX4_9PSED|nr:hypothetical protein [Pseudomonas frederiksbergensis]APC14598.1 hypothetical protein BLL42_02180 [Pseudomonas frederiksbergensis]
MNEVMRYDLDRDTDEGCADMTPISDGRFVEFEDFARVTAERDALQQRLNAADQRVDELMALIQRAIKLDIAGQYLDDEWYATLDDLNPAESVES